MTELAGPGIMQHSYCENRLGSVGIMMPFMHGRIADPVDPSKTMKTGEVGELVVKGPLNMLGYYGNEQATHDTIDADGWLHSGDLGKMDEDGYIYIVDRKKDMILTAGYNIYKAEIAKAYIVLKAGANVDADDVISYCRKHLAAYKVPREVQFVAALPTTSSGKILRRQLKTLDKDVQTSEAA